MVTVRQESVSTTEVGNKLEDEVANFRAWSVVASALGEQFGVSPTVLRLRLRALWVLTEENQGPRALQEVRAPRGGRTGFVSD